MIPTRSTVNNRYSYRVWNYDVMKAFKNIILKWDALLKTQKQTNASFTYQKSWQKGLLRAWSLIRLSLSPPSSLCWLFLSPHRAAAVIQMLSRAVTQVMFTLEPKDRNLRRASLFKLNSQACSSKTYMIDCSFDIGPSCWPYRVWGSEQIWWAGAWCLHWRQEKTDLMLVHCHPVNWIQYTRPALTDPDLFN